MPEAMKPPLNSLKFSCGERYLIPAFCGKVSFQPHFMRISSQGTRERPQKITFPRMPVSQNGPLTDETATPKPRGDSRPGCPVERSSTIVA
jgi:hypothetical protein